MPESTPIKTLQHRRDFLAAAKGRCAARSGLVLQARRKTGQDHIGIGYTATKKTGNAVARNRIKRRLRAAAQEVLTAKGKPGFDYVLIGRAGTVDRPWQSLLDDLTQALQMVHQNRRPKTSRDRSRGRKKPGTIPDDRT